jgi:hypothetical protein
MADNPIKYSDFIQPDGSISDLIKQLESLQTTYAEMINSLKSNASSAEKATKSLNNTTSEGQEATRKAAEEADRLAKAHDDLKKSQSENAKQIAALKSQQQQQNNINRLTVAMNKAAKGSYDQLSAQYSLNKIKLNAMSKEEREATEAGRALVEESRSIYEEMKRLQAETGKTALNVGNYEAATVSLRQELTQNTQALAEMKMRGEENTAAYQKLLAKTGELKDAMMDAQNEIKNMASDTSTLDSVLSGASAAAGGFSVFTGSMELFGAESENVEKAQKSLQATIAITTGIQSIQNAVQKDSALMMGISKIQSYALSKAEAYRRLIQIQGTSATVGATVAQRAFNLVAAANPYVLLAMALITVVGALVLFARNTESAAEKQTKLNEVQKTYLESLETEADRINEVGNERVKSLEAELSVAKARGASTKEINKIEDDLANARKANHAKMVGFYGEELKNLDQNKDKLYQYRMELARLQSAKAGGTKKIGVDLELNGNISKENIDNAIEAIQGKIDNYGKLVEIGTKLSDEQKQLDEDEKVRASERLKAAKDKSKEQYTTERGLLRKAEDAKIALIQNSWNKQIAETEANYSRQITDLKYQLKTEQDLTQKGKEAINSTILLLTQKRDQDLKEMADKMNAEQLTMDRTSEDILISLMQDGFDKERTLIQVDYDRKIEDLRIRLETERGLTIQQKQQLLKDMENMEAQKGVAIQKLTDQNNLNILNSELQTIQTRLETVREGSDEELNLKIQMLQKQRAIELQENASKAKEVRQSEKDINSKYDALILQQSSEFSQNKAMLLFEHNQALAASEFDLLRTTEGEKTRFRLEQEKERLKKILELNKTAANKLSDVEIATIQNTIQKIDQEISDSSKEDRDIYSMVGLNLDDDQKAAIEESTSFAIGQLQSFLQAKIDGAQAAVDAANVEVDASQKKLDAEIEARNNGYASNVTMAQKELELAKKNQEKALKEQEKARKAQKAIDTLQQVSSLVTATAGIWKSFAGTGPWGIALAIAGTALMWGSFAAAKIKAAQLTKKEYGEGGLEFLNGGSHASGNDIPLGYTKDGKDRRAEGGEALAIIRKSQTRKYRKLLPGIIDSLNKGTFEQKYMGAYETGGLSIGMLNSSADLKTLENDVRAIKEQGERRYFTDGKGRIIETYKNLRRIYNAN